MAEGQELIPHSARIEGKAESPTNRFTINEITKGSTVMSLEAALAIKVGKAEPVGYNEASGFFKNQYDHTTDAHCAWFMMEAEKAGQLDQMQQEFPDVEMRAKRIVEKMQKDRPQMLADIMARVQSPDYSPEQVRRDQEAAAEAFRILFPKEEPKQ